MLRKIHRLIKRGVSFIFLVYEILIIVYFLHIKSGGEFLLNKLRGIPLNYPNHFFTPRY